MQKENLQIAHISKQQERLWRWLQNDQLDNIQARILLEGSLDPGCFRQALQELVERHEILRTAFSVAPGMELPTQVIERHVQLSCPLVSLEAFDPLTQQNMLEKHWQELSLSPFNLEHGPLMHIKIFCIAERQHVLMLSMCALCADISTLKHLVTEILQEYALLQQGTRRSTDEEVLQYIDVASWQYGLLSADGASEQQAFWHELELAQFTTMPLPFQYSGKSGLDEGMLPVSRPQQIEIVLNTEQQRHLLALSQRLHIFPEVYVLTCWQILLWRLTEVAPLIGVARDGRPYEELATALGPYARAIPFFLSVNAEMIFERALTKTSLALQEMGEKQLYFTWEAFAAEMEKEERQVFPTGFSYDAWPAGWKAGSLTANLLNLKSWIESTPLHLQVFQIGQQMQFYLHYQPSAFSQSQARYLGELLQTLLSGALTMTQIPVSSLPLLTSEQQEQQQERLCGVTRDWPFVPLHRLFEAQVQRQPQAPALRSGTLLLSYEELEQQANQLAQALLRQGLLPGGRVALFLPRDHWAIIALLAVLKAGGTYVPLDIQTPVARLHSLLKQLEPDLVLSSQRLQEHLPSLSFPVLWVEWVQQQRMEGICPAPHVEVGPEDVAYVMYTSGSSGTPKGVLVRQGSVSNYTQALGEELRVQAGWHYATVSSLAADLGNTVIFCGLASGGCVHVLPYEQVTDGAAFANYVRAYPLDVLKIVPTHLQALLTVGAGEIMPRERLLLGGEALPWSLVQQVQAMGSTCELYNHYGPTEATIGALVNRLGRVPEIVVPPLEQRGSSVPLGRPIANMQAYVLDEQQQWVPQGVQGELYLAGVGLAAGYEPQESGVGFVEIEVGGRRERMYRTGDQVREREPGEIEFVGRRDGQVKLRGYRIELGEIEEELRRHSAVREAAVQVWAGEQEAGELVGYIVSWKQPGPGAQEVREALAQRLPAYEVPTRIVSLEQLPRTSNGKLDRKRLPPPPPPQEEEAAAEEGRTPVEEVLLQIWRQVLGITRIGRDDDFFRLGGHSLLGTQLMARLRPVFGMEVPITWLFETPTVAGLAARIQQQMLEGQGLARPEIKPVSRERPLFLSFAQQRLWFLHQMEPESIAYNVAGAARLQGHLDRTILRTSLQALVQRQESLRTSFAETEEGVVQRIRVHLTPAFPLIDLSGCEGAQREAEMQRLVQQEAEQPFDLRRGPLFRVRLLVLDAREHVVLLTMHHIISDGWSMSILISELVTLYQAGLLAEPAPLVPLAIQYADYAFWQRAWLQGEVLKEQSRYWTEQLSEAQAVELPGDSPRQAVLSGRGAVASFRLDGELKEALVALSQQEGVTLFMTLLAGWQVLLARLSGERDIVVGTDSANRSQVETEGLIGFFVNLLALRTQVRGEASFRELLQEVRAMVLGAYLHQEMPFEMVVEQLRQKRKGNRTPLVNVLFVMQNVPTVEEELPGLRVSSVESSVTAAKFELALFVREEPTGVNYSVNYSTDLFEKATVEKMMNQYKILLHDIVAHPESLVDNLEMYAEEETQRHNIQSEKRLKRHLGKLKDFKGSLIDISEQV